jgi:hypothetical protein
MVAHSVSLADHPSFARFCLATAGCVDEEAELRDSLSTTQAKRLSRTSGGFGGRQASDARH